MVASGVLDDDRLAARCPRRRRRRASRSSPSRNSLCLISRMASVSVRNISPIRVRKIRSPSLSRRSSSSQRSRIAAGSFIPRRCSDRRLDRLARLLDQRRQLAAALGAGPPWRGRRPASAVAKMASTTSSSGVGQRVDVGAVQRGDEGPVERLVHLGDDAVGLVLDLVHPLDDRLAVGGRGLARSSRRAGRCISRAQSAPRSSRSKKCSSRAAAT